MVLLKNILASKKKFEHKVFRNQNICSVYILFKDKYVAFLKVFSDLQKLKINLFRSHINHDTKLVVRILFYYP